jgi:hypothetical protein
MKFLFLVFLVTFIITITITMHHLQTSHFLPIVPLLRPVQVARLFQL